MKEELINILQRYPKDTKVVYPQEWNTQKAIQERTGLTFSVIFLIIITVLIFLTGCVRVTEETCQEKYSELLEKFKKNGNKLFIMECIDIGNRYTCMTYQGYYITTEEELKKHHEKHKYNYDYIHN